MMRQAFRVVFRHWRAWCTRRFVKFLQRRVEDLQKLQGESHAALCKVYDNSGREQRARAERGQSGCEACAQNEGISRRCMSPGTEGPPSDVMQWHDEVHAIEVGEYGTKFCRTCRGLQGHSGGSQHDDRHLPNWCGVLEPLTCTELGARPRVEPVPTHHVFRPLG